MISLLSPTARHQYWPLSLRRIAKYMWSSPLVESPSARSGRRGWPANQSRLSLRRPRKAGVGGKPQVGWLRRGYGHPFVAAGPQRNAIPSSETHLGVLPDATVPT